MATPSPSAARRTPLAHELAAGIQRDGPMPFVSFMERSLYHPEHGYYTAPGRLVGRHGDFHTSVSVGPVFGELIAAWAVRSWEEMGSPAPLNLVEQGAHDGRLMADVLTALAERHPGLAAAVRPVIVEPSPARRRDQEALLTRSGTTMGAVSWRSSLAELAAAPPAPTLFFANELLDAFPVARWRFDGREWHQLAVALDAGGHFIWQLLPAPDFRLPWFSEKPPPVLPAGYETETNAGLGSWIRSLGSAMGHGRALLLDYGREEEDYFAPHRTEGTLRGYRGHRRCDDPLRDPGEIDLTADVNFSHLAGEARRAGFRPQPSERQGTFLTRLAMPRLLAPPPPSPGWLRQFQTLTHPNHLGHSFHALVLEKDRPACRAA
jgi:SAM-dependent MidA family methyltransferase